VLQAIIILSITVGLAIAVVVWLSLKKSLDTRSDEAVSTGGQTRSAKDRRSMEIGDWGNAAFNIVFGVLLGVLAHSLAELFTATLWPLAIVIPIFFAVVFFIEWLSDKLFDRIFPSGIRAARHSKPEGRKPLMRLLSLPVGVGIGIALAQLGFGDQILGLLP
jgi:hypothetical protein